MADGVKKKRDLPKDFVRKKPDDVIAEIDATLAAYEEFKAKAQ